MATLDGSSEVVELAPGTRLRAPGLRGTAEVRDPRDPGTRDGGDELATEALDDALAATELSEVQSIVIEAAHVPISPDQEVRTSTGEEGLVLEVTDLGETVGQVVLAIDEDGTITWNFPQSQSGDLEPPANRGDGQTKTFVIRSTSPSPVADDDPTTRSLLWGVGKKVLKVLVYPIVGTALQTAARFFAGEWEEKNRPYGLRRFTPDTYRDKDGIPIGDSDWDRLGEGKALLFIHGTFSRAFSGFHGIPPETMQALNELYQGRLFAFDHFTLSHGPEQNLTEFLGRVPQGVELKLDLISHSRGGLVARALSGETADGPIPGVAIGKSIFVAVPNHGTALADPQHLTAFVDRYTSILNLIPPGPYSVVTDILEAIITTVKMIGSAALEGLPGLTSMDPTGAFLERMNEGGPTSTEYYGIAADYEPNGGLASLVADGVIDRVFEKAANDLVVPTVGVYSGSTDPAFPIPADRVLEFGPQYAIGHSSYFSHEDTGTAILNWLK